MIRTVLLALDTSTEFCSVALLFADSADSTHPIDFAAAPQYADGDVRVWFCHEATGAVSSTRLLPAVRELFNAAGLELADCAAIAFGAGPGSFTGLRTATGVAQGLAFGLGVPVVPVSTLAACAEAARLNTPALPPRVLVALDARMDEVYWADYTFDPADPKGDWQTLQPASLDAPAALPLPDVPFALAGNAVNAFGDRLPAVVAAAHVDREALPHALPVALIGLRAWGAGKAVAPELAAPDYVRNKVAHADHGRAHAG